LERQEYEKLHAVEDEMWWFHGMHANLLTAFRRRQPALPGNVLDAGCGTGGLLAKLARALPGWSPIGLDADAGACRLARAKSGRPVSCGSANQLPFADGSLAAIFSADVLCHRNVDEAEKAVVESKSFTDSEALEKHLIDFVAGDEGELLRQLQGYKVQLFSGQSVTLAPQGQAVTSYQMTSREKFLATISQPNLALILGIFGLILLYVEFTHPGLVAPGVIGGICFLLAILGFSFLPINYVGVLLMLLAIGLFVAEVKVQGFGILGMGGVVSMVIGMLILVDSPDPAVQIGFATAISAALPFAVIFIILLIAVIKSYRQRVSTGNAGMIGLIGVADSEISAAGRVRVRGEYWQAHSSAPIAAGRHVRIIEIDNLNVKVEEVRE